MRVPDHYQLLGVHPSATMEQIKAAFRRQALKLHPDKNPEDDSTVDQFKQCNDAYAVLSDARKRTDYDHSLQQWGIQQILGGFVDEIFGKRRRRKVDGRDVRYNVEISFKEAALGISRRVSFNVMQTCEECAGLGASPGGTRACPDCKGRGEVKRREGLLSMPRTCPRCGGQGRSIVAPCKACSGVGTVERPREFMVRLPAGVTTGDVKIIEGQGEPGQDGGRPGDLHIMVEVRRDPLFTRVDDHVHLKLPIGIAEAALGGSVMVPTIEGRVRMEIPPGTQTGQTFRIRDRGVKKGPERGDQLVRVVLETPVALNDEQRTLLERFREIRTEATYPMHRDFANKESREPGQGISKEPRSPGKEFSREGNKLKEREP